LEVAEAMCDRIAIVQGGRVAAQGTMDELRAQTASEGLTLEQLFLKLTGGTGAPELDAILDGLDAGAAARSRCTDHSPPQVAERHGAPSPGALRGEHTDPAAQPRRPGLLVGDIRTLVSGAEAPRCRARDRRLPPGQAAESRAPRVRIDPP